MKTILIVCTGNVFRSVTAEYALRKYLKNNKKYKVISAGTTAIPQPILAPVLYELKKKGLDAAKHKQKKLNKKMIEESNIIVAMAKSHKEFIKKKFGVEAVLYNKIVYNKNSSIADLGDLHPPLTTTSPKTEAYMKKVVDYITNATPLFAKNMKKVLK
jgi:protein-tyrosine phosphatase